MYGTATWSPHDKPMPILFLFEHCKGEGYGRDDRSTKQHLFLPDAHDGRQRLYFFASADINRRSEHSGHRRNRRALTCSYGDDINRGGGRILFRPGDHYDSGNPDNVDHVSPDLRPSVRLWIPRGTLQDSRAVWSHLF